MVKSPRQGRQVQPLIRLAVCQYGGNYHRYRIAGAVPEQRGVGPHRQVRHDQAPDGHETGMVMNATHRRHAADGDAPMSGRASHQGHNLLVPPTLHLFPCHMRLNDWEDMGRTAAKPVRV